MDIQFKTAKLKKQCNERKAAIATWGDRRAKLVGLRLDDLRAAVTLEDMRHLPGDCHEYRHRKDFVLTLNLDGGWRLFFRPLHDPIPLRPDGASLDWTHVTGIEVTDVRDPHDH